jgi:ribosomal protein L11 methyltransferase
LSAERTTTWRLTLPCTRAEAEALADDVSAFALLDAPPVLVTSEAEGEGWRLDAYFEEQPTAAMRDRLVALVPSASGVKPALERVVERDWVALSRQGLEPIRAGRFFVHAPADRGAAPAGTVALEIDAGRAFGTGRHETTAGCLAALDRLKREGAAFADIADIGTGTGLLAFAALQLWPAARAVASDIDPIAVDVAATNAAVNGIPLGRARGRLELIAADGMDHPRLRARAPYDLILANILAGPLVALAPDLARALAPGGRLVLAGLLDRQAERVVSAFTRQRLMPLFDLGGGEWPILAMRKRRLPRRVQRASQKRASGP